jgi:hypothetical protein
MISSHSGRADTTSMSRPAVGDALAMTDRIQSWFGLALTRSLVDELIYNEAREEVILIKYLDGGSRPASASAERITEPARASRLVPSRRVRPAWP